MFRYKVPDTPSCYANFLRALARHGMGEKDIVANINFFRNVPILADGTMGLHRRKAKHEVGGKPFRVASDGLDERTCRHTVEGSEISI